MRKLPVFVLALILAVATIGCDSEGETPEAELFVGTWTMVGLSDAGGDKMPAFQQGANSLTADLNANNTFEIDVDYKPESGREPLTIPGTYEVDEGANGITISPPGLAIPFDYDFETDERVVLSTQSEFINGLFETDAYSGTVEITLEK